MSVRDEENSFKTLKAGQLISSSEDSSDADDEDDGDAKGNRVVGGDDDGDAKDNRVVGGDDDGDAKDNRVTFENEDLLVKSLIAFLRFTLFRLSVCVCLLHSFSCGP